MVHPVSGVGTVAKIVALIKFAAVFSCDANHERIQRPAFQPGRHSVGSMLVL